MKRKLLIALGSLLTAAGLALFIHGLLGYLSVADTVESFNNMYEIGSYAPQTLWIGIVVAVPGLTLLTVRDFF